MPWSGGGGMGFPHEKVGDAPQKIWIVPQKETHLGVAPALFDSKRIPFYYYFFEYTLKDTLSS